MALIFKKCLLVKCSIFNALDLKIKFLDGSLVFINLENSIGFGTGFALSKPRFLLRRLFR